MSVNHPAADQPDEPDTTLMGLLSKGNLHEPEKRSLDLPALLRRLRDLPYEPTPLPPVHPRDYAAAMRWAGREPGSGLPNGVYIDWLTAGAPE